MADAGTNITSLSISVEANTGKAASKITKIADALRSLSAALTGNVNSELMSMLNSIQELSFQKSGVSAVASAIKQVSIASSGAAKSVGNLGAKVGELSVTLDNANERAVQFANTIKEVGDASQNTRLPMTDRDYTTVLGEINARLEALQAVGDKVTAKLGRVSNAASKTASSTRSAASAAQSLKASLKGIASNALTKSANAAKKAINALGRSIKNLLKSSSGGKGMFSGIEKLFKSIGRIAFYRMIRSLMKTITQGFKEGIKNLYAYSDLVGTRFKPSMDKMATAALFVKNAFAAMAAPLINVVAPIIDMIGDKVAALANKMAEFFAALTGQNIYTRAIKYAQEYNDALDETAKKLERWLAPFDEINRMSDSGGSGNADAIDYSKMFEEAIVSSEMSQLAQKIIEAFESADLSPIGRAIGEKIKSALDALDWESIKTKASKIARMITSFINGALSVKDIGKSIGKTIAEALNTAVTFATTLVSTLNWSALGKAIGQSIRTFISTFNFENVGTGLNDFAMGILDALQTAINEIGEINPESGMTGWEELGTRIAKSLANVKFGEIFKTTVKLGGSIITGILDAVISFLDETKTNGFWDELGTGIGEAIASIDWINLIGKIAKIGVDIVKGIFQSVKTAVATGFGVDDETASFIVDAIAVGALTAKIAKLFRGTKALTGGFSDKNQQLSQQTELTAAETSAVGALDNAYGFSAQTAIPALVGALAIMFKGLTDVNDNTNKLSDTIAAAWSGSATTVQTKTGEIVNSLQPLNVAATQTVPRSFQTMGGAIDQHLSWARNSMQKFCKNMDVIPHGIKNMTDNVAGNLEISAKNEESYVRTESENWRKYNQARVNDTIEAAKRIRQTNNALPSGGAFPASVIFGAVGIGMLGGLGRGRAFGGVGGLEFSVHDSGGFPSAGSLFVAGEGSHSPEYVGSFNGQTGVWNSDQLVQAMYTALSAALANNQSGGDIYLDGEVIYKNVVRRNNNQVRSTGRAALLT